jgi:ketosteroid isomerase-like protein
MQSSRFGGTQFGWFRCAAALTIGLAIAGSAQAADSKAAGQLSADQASLEKAEDALFQADVTRDLSVIQRGMADEVYIVHANGMIQSKADYLQTTEKAEYPTKTLTTVDRVVRVFGNVGISRGVKNIVINFKPGKDTPLAVRYLTVYLKRDGRWQLLELRQIGAKQPESTVPDIK